MPAVQPAAPAATHAVHDAREPVKSGLAISQAVVAPSDFLINDPAGGEQHNALSALTQ